MHGVARIATLVALVSWLSAVPLPARAQNLLVNPDFDANVEGWTAAVDWIDAFFDSEDFAGAQGSGSARVVNSRATSGESGISQCIGIPEANGATSYDLTVQSRVSEGQGLTGTSVLGLWFSSGSACNPDGDLASVFPSNGLVDWLELGGRFVVPAGTRSIRFDLRVNKFGDVGSFEARFDHAYLPEPSAALAAGVALVALVALHRRGSRAC